MTDIGMHEISSAERLNRTIAMSVATVDPKIKDKVIQSVYKPLREGIMKEYGHILDIAPRVQVIPITPQQGKEKEALENLIESAIWASDQEGVQSAMVYQLVSDDERHKAPTFAVVLTTEDKNVISRLKSSEKGLYLQKALKEMSTGKGATDSGVMSVNSIMIGL